MQVKYTIIYSAPKIKMPIAANCDISPETMYRSSTMGLMSDPFYNFAVYFYENIFDIVRVIAVFRQ